MSTTSSSPDAMFHIQPALSICDAIGSNVILRRAETHPQSAQNSPNPTTRHQLPRRMLSTRLQLVHTLDHSSKHINYILQVWIRVFEPWLRCARSLLSGFFCVLD